MDNDMNKLNVVIFGLSIFLGGVTIGWGLCMLAFAAGWQ